MGLFEILVLLVVVGVGLYLFNTFATAIDARIKRLINALVLTFLVLFALWWLLGFFGYGFGPHVAYPRRCGDTVQAEPAV